MENIPDYQIAAEKAQELFEKLGLHTGISEPKAKVQDEWANISYIITFSKGTHSSQQIELEYNLGIGHVSYKINMPDWMFPTPHHANVFRIAHEGKQIKKGNELLQAEVAAMLAKRQKVKPKPYEVLAYYSRDAIEAIENTFEDWASNLGYDLDSRKAESVYNTCRDSYSKLLKVMNKQQIEQMAEFANQF